MPLPRGKQELGSAWLHWDANIPWISPQGRPEGSQILCDLLSTSLPFQGSNPDYLVLSLWITMGWEAFPSPSMGKTSAVFPRETPKERFPGHQTPPRSHGHLWNAAAPRNPRQSLILVGFFPGRRLRAEAAEADPEDGQAGGHSHSQGSEGFQGRGEREAAPPLRHVHGDGFQLEERSQNPADMEHLVAVPCDRKLREFHGNSMEIPWVFGWARWAPNPQNAPGAWSAPEYWEVSLSIQSIPEFQDSRIE